MNTFVFYLALGIAVAGVQAPSQTPESHHPEKQSVHTQLSETEVSRLRTSAEARDASAQFNLGKAYEYGNGVPKNDESAVKWYRKAADQGNSDAEVRLGIMYRLGLGVSQDKQEAVLWYRRSAKQGNAQAMFNLGVSYYNGDGVSPSPNLAYAWFLLAQEAGNAAAEDAVKRSAEEGGRLGTPDALRQAAAMYEKGDELPQNYAKAAKWYGKAADLSPEAGVKLASMLIDGTGVPRDYEQALTLCQSAAKQNYAPGQFCVGYLHQRGLGVPAAPKEAAKWYELASERRFPPAMMALADMYWKGKEVAVDRPRAFCLLLLASQRGAPDAKTQAQSLWKEMSKNDLKRLEKELRALLFDPQKVFAMMQAETTPDTTKGPSQP